MSYIFMCLSAHMKVSQWAREKVLFDTISTAHCRYFLTHRLLLDWPQWRLHQRCGVYLLRLWEQEGLRSSQERKRKFVFRVLKTDLYLNDLPVWLTVGEGGGWGGGGGDKSGCESESVYYKQLRCAITVKKLFCLCTVVQIIPVIIHQIFLLTRDWPKRVTWTNIPQLKLGNIREYSPISKLRALRKRFEG